MVIVSNALFFVKNMYTVWDPWNPPLVLQMSPSGQFKEEFIPHGTLPDTVVFTQQSCGPAIRQIPVHQDKYLFLAIHTTCKED
jgi:hypothetical protein